MKHLHMLMAVLVIVLFLYQSYLVLTAKDRTPRVVKIANHIVMRWCYYQAHGCCFLY